MDCLCATHPMHTNNCIVLALRASPQSPEGYNARPLEPSSHLASRGSWAVTDNPEGAPSAARKKNMRVQHVGSV